MLADLVRGAGGGAFSVSSGGKRRKSLSKEKVGLDLDAIAGGKILLGKDVRISTLWLMKVLSTLFPGNRSFDSRSASKPLSQRRFQHDSL
jgi:hypothetical protein